ncbi:hypothetical protein E2C01_038568 [Portunus trituberculatus]|uniref:Uncharacterized protein n=1 Tax=Portunus trituberculatus TaxID=210409 RepID=A0A5B7FH57_PORTR|nr:hypothetical protein [Portunus trituberculatus]
MALPTVLSNSADPAATKCLVTRQLGAAKHARRIRNNFLLSVFVKTIGRVCCTAWATSLCVGLYWRGPVISLSGRVCCVATHAKHPDSWSHASANLCQHRGDIPDSEPAALLVLCGRARPTMANTVTVMLPAGHQEVRRPAATQGPLLQVREWLPAPYPTTTTTTTTTTTRHTGGNKTG